MPVHYKIKPYVCYLPFLTCRLSYCLLQLNYHSTHFRKCGPELAGTDKTCHMHKHFVRLSLNFFFTLHTSVSNHYQTIVALVGILVSSVPHSSQKMSFQHPINKTWCTYIILCVPIEPSHAAVVEGDLAQLAYRTLQWRHNGHDGVSNHQPHDCLRNRLLRHRSKKTSKLRVTGLCAWNSPVTGEFPAQMASSAENVSIWWRHHGTAIYQHIH